VEAEPLTIAERTGFVDPTGVAVMVDDVIAAGAALFGCQETSNSSPTCDALTLVGAAGAGTTRKAALLRLQILSPYASVAENAGLTDGVVTTVVEITLPEKFHVTAAQAEYVVEWY